MYIYIYIYICIHTHIIPPTSHSQCREVGESRRRPRAVCLLMRCMSVPSCILVISTIISIIDFINITITANPGDGREQCVEEINDNNNTIMINIDNIHNTHV